MANPNITVLGKEFCQFCVSAQSMLKRHQMNFTYKSLGKDYTEEEFRKLAETHNHKTFPMIFIDDEMIGGAAELNRFLRGK